MAMSDDWIKEDRDHLLRMEREETARTIARWRGAGYVAAAVAVAAVLLGGIWALLESAENNAERTSEAVIACQQSGGTMFDLKTGGRVCLRLEGDNE